MRDFIDQPWGSKAFWLTAGAGSLGVVMAVDVLTPPELSVSLFYLLPIVMVGWCAGGNLGMAMALLSSLAWAEAEVVNGLPYASAGYLFWNAVVRLAFFLVVARLLGKLRCSIERERRLALTDSLTGVDNRRSFFSRLSEEVARSSRYQRPFAVVYLDVDHFKRINDTQGHDAGDALLYALGDCMRRTLRKTDTVARLGGDEFALLLPETTAQPAELLVAKLRFQLLEVARKGRWPVTFSIGMLSSAGRIDDADELMSKVDAMMYEVKRGGRDGIRFASAA